MIVFDAVSGWRRIIGTEDFSRRERQIMETANRGISSTTVSPYCSAALYGFPLCLLGKSVRGIFFHVVMLKGILVLTSHIEACAKRDVFMPV